MISITISVPLIVLQARVLELDETHFFPFTVGLQVAGANATIMWMLPRPRALRTFWPALLPQFNFDRHDRTLLGGILGLSFGIEL